MSPGFTALRSIAAKASSSRSNTFAVNVRVGQGFDVHPWSDESGRPLVPIE